MRSVLETAMKLYNGNLYKGVLRFEKSLNVVDQLDFIRLLLAIVSV